MFRCALRLLHTTRPSASLGRMRPQPPPPASMLPPRRHSHGEPDIYADQFDQTYVQLFDNADIDGWMARKAMNDLLGMDMVPEPTIVAAGLRAARKCNDYALAVRWLEGCRLKCGNEKAIYRWLMQEIRPTLDELGVSTVEEMGYACPELACESVYTF